MGDLAVFAPLIFLAYWKRRDRDTHKRLAVIATIALMGAPLSRFPIHPLKSEVVVQSIVMLGFLPRIVAYDRFSLRRVHRATLWASVYFMFVHVARFPIALTPMLQWFADHMVKLV